MRILGQMVMKDEADRYLDACLSWAGLFLDEIHVFDDHSVDESVEIALAHGAVVTRRPDDVPTFIADEPRFREAGWRALEALSPEEGDWVFAFDADEFLVAADDERATLLELCANTSGCLGYHLPIPEVFAVDELDDGFLGNPQIRIDGFWSHISGVRLAAWRPGGVWFDKGSVPSYAQERASSLFMSGVGELALLHYGYADPRDVQQKYDRYSAVPEGHSNQHIQSIRHPPVLRKWDGSYTNIWRGARSRTATDV